MELVKSWIQAHPNLSAWLVLASGMIVLLVIEARNLGLAPSQWFWLILITALVAGLCIWIISWGDDEEEEEMAHSDGNQ
jgi:hypothetical protein